MIRGTANSDADNPRKGSPAIGATGNKHTPSASAVSPPTSLMARGDSSCIARRRVVCRHGRLWSRSAASRCALPRTARNTFAGMASWCAAPLAASADDCSLELGALGEGSADATVSARGKCAIESVSKDCGGESRMSDRIVIEGVSRKPFHRGIGHSTSGDVGATQ